MKKKYMVAFSLMASTIFLFVGMGFCQQSGEGKTGKAEWAEVLKSKVAQQVSDKGLVNYQEGYIEAVGIGAPPERYYGKPQARPMALRAAQVDGYRNLLEIVQGVKIDSQTTVKDFTTESDSINAQVSGLVRGAAVVKKEYLSDGTVEVILRMSLRDVVRTVLPTAIDNDQKKDIKVREPILPPSKPAPAAEFYTGLVVDARGIGANAAVSPKIFDESGVEVYGTLIANKEYASKEGLCDYASDLVAAQRHQRITNKPLTVKAVRAEGTGMSDLKISSEDAQKISSAEGSLSFLQKCRVVIVIEPPTGCVTAGTAITLADGSKKPIEGLKVNDFIAAYDSTGRKITEARIEQVLKHNSIKYVLHQVKTSGNHDLFVTGNHPLLTKSGEWKQVDQLRPGDVVYILNTQTKKIEETTIAVIIRDQMEQSVVYNLKTSQGNYIANDIIIHNKCLKAGTLIDTPLGTKAVDTIKAGDMVLGQKDGIVKPVRVTNVYTKMTVLPSLPGKLLSESIAVTGNHLVSINGKFVEASKTDYPFVAIKGAVYDLQTEEGNYFSGGILMKAGE